MTLDASAAVNAAQDEVVKAERRVLMEAEFAQYAIEDYADRPAIAALLDALTVYQAAEAARRTASDALAAAVKQELDDIADTLTKAARELEVHAEETRLDRLAEAQRDACDEREAL